MHQSHQLRIERLEHRHMLSVAGMIVDKFDPLAIDISDERVLLNKVGRDLAALHVAHRDAVNNSVFNPKSDLLFLRDNEIEIVAVEKNGTNSLAGEIAALGLTDMVSNDSVVAVWTPFDLIDDLATLPNLQFAWPNYKPFHDVGAVTSQGDSAMRTDVVRQRFPGINGSGITVGVVSDSFDSPIMPPLLTNADQDVMTGDIPPLGTPEECESSNHATVVCELDDSSLGVDEGRAMIQLIHDVAPGLHFLKNLISSGV